MAESDDELTEAGEVVGEWILEYNCHQMWKQFCEHDSSLLVSPMCRMMKTVLDDEPDLSPDTEKLLALCQHLFRIITACNNPSNKNLTASLYKSWEEVYKIYPFSAAEKKQMQLLTLYVFSKKRSINKTEYYRQVQHFLQPVFQQFKEPFLKEALDTEKNGEKGKEFISWTQKVIDMADDVVKKETMETNTNSSVEASLPPRTTTTDTTEVRGEGADENRLDSERAETEKESPFLQGMENKDDRAKLQGVGQANDGTDSQGAEEKNDNPDSQGAPAEHENESPKSIGAELWDDSPQSQSRDSATKSQGGTGERSTSPDSQDMLLEKNTPTTQSAEHEGKESPIELQNKEKQTQSPDSQSVLPQRNHHEVQSAEREKGNPNMEDLLMDSSPEPAVRKSKDQDSDYQDMLLASIDQELQKIEEEYKSMDSQDKESINSQEAQVGSSPETESAQRVNEGPSSPSMLTESSCDPRSSGSKKSSNVSQGKRKRIANETSESVRKKLQDQQPSSSTAPESQVENKDSASNEQETQDCSDNDSPSLLRALDDSVVVFGDVTVTNKQRKAPEAERKDQSCPSTSRSPGMLRKSKEVLRLQKLSSKEPCRAQAREQDSDTEQDIGESAAKVPSRKPAAGSKFGQVVKVSTAKTSTPRGKAVVVTWSSDEDEEEFRPHKKKTLHVNKPKFNQSKQQGRVKWSIDEEDMLRRAVKAHGVGNWRAMIDNFPFRGRTSVNLKDKWRNMINKGAAFLPDDSD